MRAAILDPAATRQWGQHVKSEYHTAARLEHLTEHWSVPNGLQITAVQFSPDGRWLAVTTHKTLYMLPFDEYEGRFGAHLEMRHPQ